MNKEFKLSILEMIILLLISKKDMYGYDITQKVYNILSIKEGITFPILKKLHNEGLLEVYQKNTSDLDIKIYYHLTENGIIKLKKYLTDYDDIIHKINLLKKGNENDE